MDHIWHEAGVYSPMFAAAKLPLANGNNWGVAGVGMQSCGRPLWPRMRQSLFYFAADDGDLDAAGMGN